MRSLPSSHPFADHWVVLNGKQGSIIKIETNNIEEVPKPIPVCDVRFNSSDYGFGAECEKHKERHEKLSKGTLTYAPVYTWRQHLEETLHGLIVEEFLKNYFGYVAAKWK